MHIVWSLIAGLIIGALAKLVMPGKDPGGLLMTMVLGLVGASVAGFLGRSLGMYNASDTGPGLIASVLGAVLILVLYRVVRRRSTT